jgi:pimeloyl-ACP methyl ester carboxylesterase
VSAAVCLSPPGFGAPLPEGFDASPAGYRDWLAECLGMFRTPVDLVGHDIGGDLVFAVARTCPRLVRSWVSDTLGTHAPTYEWHPLAKLWRTPKAGEEWIKTMVEAPLAARVEALSEWGIGGTVAERLAAAVDSDMGRAILSFYRSARLAADGPSAAVALPGLALVALGDTMVGTPDMHREIAKAAGAQVAELANADHWWMVHDPAQAATVMSDFWRGLSRD